MPNNGRNGKNGNGKKKSNGKKNGAKGPRNVGGLVKSMVAASLSNNGGNRRPMRQGVSKQRGSDFLGKVTVLPAPSTTTERIIATFPVSPSAYPGTRITQISELWERYRFTSFSIRYVSAVPNTLACQFVLYIDTDPNDDPTTILDSDALIRQAVSQAGAQQWNFNQSKAVKLAIRSDGQLMYTGVDKQNKRFTQQGIAYLIQITNPINFNGEALTAPLEAGSLFLDWEIDFQIAQINPAAVTRAGTPPSGDFVQITAWTLPGTLIVTSPDGDVVDYELSATSLYVDGWALADYVGVQLEDGTKIIENTQPADGEYKCNTHRTTLPMGVDPRLVWYTTGTADLTFVNADISVRASGPVNVSYVPDPIPPLSVDLDNIRRMIAECMTESNVTTGNAVLNNPVDDTYDKSHGYDVEAHTYPDWDDEGLLDDDDPEYDAKFARRDFAKALTDCPSREPIGEPIVITAQTIDINTNVHISDETRSKIDTAVRMVMANAPELCPYSIVVPFIRDELDCEHRLNIDDDPEDL